MGCRSVSAEPCGCSCCFRASCGAEIAHAQQEEKFQKARNTIDKLLDERGPARDGRRKGQVLYFECDVSSLALARKAATVFLAHPQAKRLDVAYFCAGAPSTWGARPLSEDGIDLIM